MPTFPSSYGEVVYFQQASLFTMANFVFFIRLCRAQFM